MRTAPSARRGSPLAASLLALAIAACGGDGDAADAAPDDGVDAGPAAYMEACELEPDNCVAPDMCFMFNDRGPHCTHTCADAGDCPAPSPGCNGMGLCKAP
jgi:hypothetical protein